MRTKTSKKTRPYLAQIQKVVGEDRKKKFTTILEAYSTRPEQIKVFLVGRIGMKGHVLKSRGEFYLHSSTSQIRILPPEISHILDAHNRPITAVRTK